MQNLLLAAAALGLGTRLTIPFQDSPAQLTELLRIPESYAPAALIPLGYPAEPDHLGGGIRKPIADVTFIDRWGNRPSSTSADERWQQTAAGLQPDSIG